VEIDENSEVGTLYRNQFFHWKVKGKQQRQRGQKTQKLSEFLRFLPSLPFLLPWFHRHGFIDTIARLEKVSRHQMKTAIVADRIQQDRTAVTQKKIRAGGNMVASSATSP